MHSQTSHLHGEDSAWMSRALRLARRGLGRTSPNPMVGAILTRAGNLIGQGWHQRAGQPHAEIEAIRTAQERGHSTSGATLYVTLEPCSTQGRTPPCTNAIIQAGIRRVVVAAIDPNPKHAGRGLDLLRKAGLKVDEGIRAAEATRLNAAFNHWIVHGTPWVTVKAAMSADGKIATVSGESKWITGAKARAFGMRLRQGADAILVGVNTVLRDNPHLTVRRGDVEGEKRLKRIVLDGQARTPLHAHVVCDARASLTTIAVSESAPPKRVSRLRECANVLIAPCTARGQIDLAWLLAVLGREAVTSLLVEGGGEVNASFLIGGLAHQIAFFFAPRILGGRAAPGSVGGAGVASLANAVALSEVLWRRLGDDLLLTARVGSTQAAPHCL